MNKLFTKIAALALGATMAVGVGVAVGSASNKEVAKVDAASPATLTFTAACGGSGTDSDGNTWTITSNAAESTYDADKGIHYGTSKVAVSYLNLSTSGISGTITQISVNASGASGTSAKLDVTVGGNAFDSQKSLTATATTYNLTGSASGAVVVSISQSSAKKALYCKSIAVTYTAAGNKLGTPSPVFNRADNTITWATVQNATSYELELDSVSKGTQTSGYSVASVPVNESHTVSVVAKASGYTDSNAGTVTFKRFATKGTQSDPFTVADARRFIDTLGNSTSDDVYVSGIISQIDSYNSNYHSITYWISDDGTTTNQLEVYSGKGLNQADFSSVSDLSVEGEVVVCGKLKLYSAVYEFTQNNYLISYTAPAGKLPTPAPQYNPGARTISWTVDSNAVRYEGKIDTGSFAPVTSPLDVSSYSTTDVHTITLKAIGDGTSYTDSDEATYKFAVLPANSSSNPYTVEQARLLIDTDMDKTNIYTQGKVSTAPSGLSDGQLTYKISSDGTTTTELEIYKGKGLNGANFTSVDDVKIGDRLIVYGTLKKYNSTYEYDSNSQLFSQVRVYTVTYDGNGATGGTVPEDSTEYTTSSNTVTVLGNTGNLVKVDEYSTNFSFGGWNTKADGTGITYQANATFTISEDTTLYAIWNDPRTEVTLSAEDMTLNLGDADKDPVITSSPSGHTSGYTLTSATTSVATIISNKVHAVAKGTSVVTVHIDNDATYKYVDATFTVTVTQQMADNGTGTINFGSATGSTKIDSTSVTGDDSQTNTWTITTVMSSISFTQNASYSQVGASSKPATSIDFSTTLGKTVKITDFSIKLGGFASTAGDVELQIGSTTVATGALSGTDDVIVGGDITDTTGNALSISITNIAKGIKVYYISYTYITEIHVTGVTVSPTEVTLTPNGTQQLTPTIAPENATVQTVSYASDDTNVATVSPSGLITAVADGTATITVTTTDGGYQATCDVTVETPVGAYVNIASTLTGIEDGDYVELDITYGGTFATGLIAVASNSNIDIALTDNGDGTGSVLVEFASKGTATISFKDGTTPIENIGSSCLVTIVEELNAINAHTQTVSDLTFTQAYGTGGATASDSTVWSVTSDAEEESFGGSDGIHYGSKNNSVSYIQLSTSGISGTITKVVVTTRDSKETANVSVTLGSGSVSCSGSTTATNISSDFTFTGNGSGSITVRVARDSKVTGAIYVKSVKVTYLSTTTTNIANTNPQVQKEVLDFVDVMNTDLAVCSSSQTLSTSVWSGLAAKYATAVSSSSNAQLFTDMFKYATATPRAGDGTATTGDSLQNALARYNYVLEKYGIDDYADFLGRVEAGQVTPKVNVNIFGLLNSNSFDSTAIVVIVSIISVSAIGGYFFLRKRREEN